MLKPEIRKIVTFEEETFIEGYKSADTPPYVCLPLQP